MYRLLPKYVMRWLSNSVKIQFEYVKGLEPVNSKCIEAVIKSPHNDGHQRASAFCDPLYALVLWLFLIFNGTVERELYTSLLADS